MTSTGKCRMDYCILVCAMHTRVFVHVIQGINYYTHYYTDGIQSLYPWIMHILIFPSKIWAKSVHYTQQNMISEDCSEPTPARNCEVGKHFHNVSSRSPNEQREGVTAQRKACAQEFPPDHLCMLFSWD